MDGFIILLALTLVMLPVNFLPTIVARCRKHRYRLAITVINVIVWIATAIFTFVATPVLLALIVVWCWALIWACTPNVETKVA
jgi:hypothetical protein